MKPFSDLQAGDVVEVCRVVQFGVTEWIAAIIVEVREHAIGVRYMRPNPAGDYIMLHCADRGRVWR